VHGIQAKLLPCNGCFETLMILIRILVRGTQAKLLTCNLCLNFLSLSIRIFHHGTSEQLQTWEICLTVRQLLLKRYAGILVLTHLPRSLVAAEASVMVVMAVNVLLLNLHQ
jgi:hypothetical protein